MNKETVSAIFLTIQVAGLGTLLILLPAVILGYYFARKNTLKSRILSTIVGLPLVMPPTAIGYLILRSLAMDGPLGSMMQKFDINILLTWKAAVIANAVMALPLMVRTAKVAFEGIDPHLEMMARTLGHGPIRTFALTTIPLAYRGLLAALILGFTRAVGEFGATITVAGNIPFRTQTLASAIFTAQQVGNNAEAYYLIGLSLLLGFCAILATEYLSNRPDMLVRK